MNYAHPETLVDTTWSAAHLDDPNVRFFEVDVDAYSYDEGHIRGAIGWEWSRQLCDTVERDILSKSAFEALARAAGLREDDTVVVYGDNNNWFAAWAIWQLKIYGHRDVRMMDGGRKKWLAEGRPLTNAVPTPTPSNYKAHDADISLRAFVDDVRAGCLANGIHLVDVRSTLEFSGELLAPPGLPETCQRGGHIPGAVSVPWGLACNADGTFKSRRELEELYRSVGVDNSKPIYAYCRVGERSSHTWFALKYLLGFDDVRNYDGSWTEWGNLVRAPVAVGPDVR